MVGEQHYLESTYQKTSKQEGWFHHKFKALGTINYITVRSASQELATKAFSQTYNLILNFEEKYSRYKSTSLIGQLNSALKLGKSRQSVKFRLDPETAELINLSFEAFRREAGLFDITSGILRYIWHSGRQNLPTKAELEKMKEFVGMQKLD